MSEKDPNSKYLTLWLCVIIAAAIILGGWFVAMKYNFQKINQELSRSGSRTSEQATNDLEQMFAGVQDVLDNSVENDKITAEDEKILDKTQEAVKAADEALMGKISETDKTDAAAGGEKKDQQ